MNLSQRGVHHCRTIRGRSSFWIAGFIATGSLLACDDAPNTPINSIAASAGSGGATSPNNGDATGGLPNIENPCEKSDAGLESQDADELFGADKIPSFDVYLPADAWEKLKVDAQKEIYVPAQACFDGKAVGLVGFRFKGAYGSLYNCFDAAGNNTCRKLGMKIKFNEYLPEQRLFGLKRLNFQGYRYDDSYIKERLSYDLYRSMDIVAPRAAWALLRVNDEPQGLFGMVEQIDGRFTKDRWPDDGDGNLFKELWPDKASSSSILSKLETNKDAPDVSAIKTFVDAVKAATDDNQREVLGRYTDLDYWARYMAVDDAIANFDGITTYYTTGSPDAAGNHNFYIYQENANKFTIIPWDLESTLSLSSNFGYVPYWQTKPTDCALTYPVWGGANQVIAPGCNRLFQALSTDLTVYRAVAQQLLDGPFAQDRMVANVDALASFIREEAQSDPHGPGAAGFENSVDYIKQELPNLRSRLQHYLSGEVSVPLQIDVAAVMDFEAADDFGIRDGTGQLSNAQTSKSVEVNTDAPMDGLKSLRILFDYGNDIDPWQQWMWYQIPLAAAPKDVAGLNGIRLKMRSNAERMVRFDLISPNNSKSSEGINFGWDLTVSTTTSELTVLFADAAVPIWADDPGDDLDQVLQTLLALEIQPICNNRDASGQLPDGVSDIGWVDVDDIEFF